METGLRGIAGPCQSRADAARESPVRAKLDMAVHGLGDALPHPDGWREGSGGTSGGGTVTGVTATAPIASSGGTAPDMSWSPTADITAGNQQIVNLADPTSAQSAATKAYVDLVGAAATAIALLSNGVRFLIGTMSNNQILQVQSGEVRGVSQLDCGKWG